MFRDIMDRAEEGHAALIFLAGDGGIGKTRLVRTFEEEAARRDWDHAIGRANPVETGVPYALFADALLPALARLDANTRTVLTRGADEELAFLFPSLAPPDRRHAILTGGEMGEFKSRVHWNFTELVKRYTVRSPLLVQLEDLQWADPSSLELLHFIARHLSTERIIIVGTYKPAELEGNPSLRRMLQSLSGLGVCQTRELQPLTREATDELVRTIFQTGAGVARAFAAQLHRWTDGNPFFIQETLKALVLSGRLQSMGGQWVGWEVEQFELPGSIRDAILQLVEPLSDNVRDLANLASVLGTRFRYAALEAVAGLPQTELISALDELRARHVLVERETDEIVYEFSHALVRETLYSELGRAKVRYLHGLVAERLEAWYGEDAADRADELAFHFSRSHGASLDRKAAQYLAAAGRSAFAKYANGEAATYLAAAVERMQSDEQSDPAELGRLLERLARARQRLGDYDGAMALWERVRYEAQEAGDWARVGACERRMGLASFWSGRPEAAMRHYEAGLEAAARAGDRALQARLSVAKAMCLHQLGRPEESKTVVEEALALAEGGSQDLLARVHRAIMLLHVWTGPVSTARQHGEQAIRLSAGSEDRTLVFSAHWGMGVLEGLSGNSDALAEQIERMHVLANEVNSPVRRVWIAEMEIEYKSAHGEWTDAIALGERSIALARSLNQSILLPRLLVWTALLYLARGEIEHARGYIEKAWRISGAEAADGWPNLHTVIPAHIGRAALELAMGNHEEAIRIGEAGLEMADRHGYVVWSIHRLVPIIAESLLWIGDLDRARRLGERLKEDSNRQGHRLGLAWAVTCDALVAWLAGDAAEGARLLEAAAVKLEEIPFVYDAARVRRQLAGRLAEIGDRDGAIRELRAVHKIFVRLGARPELEKTRVQFKELKKQPPVGVIRPGAAGLTGRELDVARLVRERMSNRRIARTLGIADRTVSTHLSNIYRKLDLSGRGELADWIRIHDIPQ